MCLSRGGAWHHCVFGWTNGTVQPVWTVTTSPDQPILEDLAADAERLEFVSQAIPGHVNTSRMDRQHRETPMNPLRTSVWSDSIVDIGNVYTEYTFFMNFIGPTSRSSTMASFLRFTWKSKKKSRTTTNSSPSGIRQQPAGGSCLLQRATSHRCDAVSQRSRLPIAVTAPASCSLKTM